MTENVLSNIFESLSRGDKATAETQLAEFFKKASSASHQPGDVYDLEADDQHADTDQDKRFNVRNRRTGKVVGMGLAADAAQRYANTRDGLPPIGEDAGDAGPKDTGPWIAAIKQVKNLFKSDAPADATPDEVEDLRSDMDVANVALHRFERGFPDQGLKKLRELGSDAYAALRSMLPGDYRDYMDANQDGGITAIPEEAGHGEVSPKAQAALAQFADVAAFEDYADYMYDTHGGVMNWSEDMGFDPNEITTYFGQRPNITDDTWYGKWEPTAIPESNSLAGLMEEFKGFTVVDKLANKEGAQVGNADSVPVNAKSPVPNIKAAKRVGGAPVEIKAEEHKGFDAEKAPTVKDVKVKNLAPQPKRGEFSDKLDNVEGAQVGNADKVKINTVSPIGSKSRD
jgi:hypothetical protein